MRKGKAFTQQIIDLVTEIEFALRWEQSIIIFAIYRSSHVLDDAEKSLEAALALYKQGLKRIRLRNDLSNVIEPIEKTEETKNIFSIADLSQGGGNDRADAYRLLNLHREYFLEKKIRSVFWLTKDDAQKLSSIAPDFWAFRHRIIDFTKNRATPTRSATTKRLSWVEWPWYIFEANTKEALKYRKELLANLSDKPETKLMRADLCGEIGGLYIRNQNYTDALKIIKEGLDSISNLLIPALEGRLLIALAIISLQVNAYEDAQAYLKKIMVLEPKTPHLFGLLAQQSRLAGQRTKALTFIKKELRLRPKSAFAWNESGNIYADLGRTEDAIFSYETSSTLSPKRKTSCINKCAVLASTGRLDEARSILNGCGLSEITELEEIKRMQVFNLLNT